MPPTIQINLTEPEWNQILAILGEVPYKVVANLIHQIQGQAQGQREAPQRPTLVPAQ